MVMTAVDCLRIAKARASLHASWTIFIAPLIPLLPKIAVFMKGMLIENTIPMMATTTRISRRVKASEPSARRSPLPANRH